VATEAQSDTPVVMDIDHPVPIPPIKLQENTLNINTTTKLNQPIEKNQQSLLKLQEML
jgi:hypothetical protein